MGPQHGVEPGGCVVYKWMVPEIAGPNNNEPARVHSYHSYVALQQDSDAGLIGPQIVYAKGQMNHTMANYREFPLLYMIYTEADSWLSGKNKTRLTGSDNSNTKRQAWGNHGWHASNNNGNHGDDGNNSNDDASSTNASGVGSFDISNTNNLWSGN